MHLCSHAGGLFAGISAKQVQIILEDLRQEVERQSANGNNGIITASHTSVACHFRHCIHDCKALSHVSLFISCPEHKGISLIDACANILGSILLITSWACCVFEHSESLAGKIPAVKAAARSQEDADPPVRVGSLQSADK